MLYVHPMTGFLWEEVCYDPGGRAVDSVPREGQLEVNNYSMHQQGGSAQKFELSHVEHVVLISSHECAE